MQVMKQFILVTTLLLFAASLAFALTKAERTLQLKELLESGVPVAQALQQMQMFDADMSANELLEAVADLDLTTVALPEGASPIEAQSLLSTVAVLTAATPAEIASAVNAGNGSITVNDVSAVLQGQEMTPEQVSVVLREADVEEAIITAAVIVDPYVPPTPTPTPLVVVAAAAVAPDTPPLFEVPEAPPVQDDQAGSPQ